MTANPHGVTDEELTNLTDAEREAIKESETSAAELAALKKIAGEGEGDEDEPRPRLPLYDVKPVERYDEQMAALEPEYNEAMESFKAGDLELDALLAKQRELDARRTELREQKLKADLATDFNTKAVRAEWMGQVQDFFARTRRVEDIDYTKPSLNVAFDAALKTLAADPANADKSTTWFLRSAHKLVQADFDMAADPDRGEHQDANDEGGAGGDPDFSALDKLEGIEFEDALARLPETKQDRYLRSR